MKAMVLEHFSGHQVDLPLKMIALPEPMPGEKAAAIPLRPEYQEFPLEEANRALRELREGKIRGAKVLRVS